MENSTSSFEIYGNSSFVDEMQYSKLEDAASISSINNPIDIDPITNEDCYPEDVYFLAKNFENPITVKEETIEYDNISMSSDVEVLEENVSEKDFTLSQFSTLSNSNYVENFNNWETSSSITLKKLDAFKKFKNDDIENAVKKEKHSETNAPQKQKTLKRNISLMRENMEYLYHSNFFNLDMFLDFFLKLLVILICFLLLQNSSYNQPKDINMKYLAMIEKNSLVYMENLQREYSTFLKQQEIVFTKLRQKNKSMKKTWDNKVIKLISELDKLSNQLLKDKKREEEILIHLLQKGTNMSHIIDNYENSHQKLLQNYLKLRDEITRLEIKTDGVTKLLNDFNIVFTMNDNSFKENGEDVYINNIAKTRAKDEETTSNNRIDKTNELPHAQLVNKQPISQIETNSGIVTRTIKRLDNLSKNLKTKFRKQFDERLMQNDFRPKFKSNRAAIKAMKNEGIKRKREDF